MVTWLHLPHEKCQKAICINAFSSVTNFVTNVTFLPFSPKNCQNGRSSSSSTGSKLTPIGCFCTSTPVSFFQYFCTPYSRNRFDLPVLTHPSIVCMIRPISLLSFLDGELKSPMPKASRQSCMMHTSLSLFESR